LTIWYAHAYPLVAFLSTGLNVEHMDERKDLAEDFPHIEIKGIGI
jgi:hypothetical protein